MPGDGYDPKITFKKFIYGWITGLVTLMFPFTLSYIQEFDWPPEMIIWVPVLLALVYALQNAWKHWNDTLEETVEPTI
jgi:hypothetical protein